MQKTKAETRRAIGLKLRPEVYDKIVELSEKENRTINNMVETILLRTIEAPTEI